jgi:hypothetical protein
MAFSHPSSPIVSSAGGTGEAVINPQLHCPDEAVCGAELPMLSAMIKIDCLRKSPKLVAARG